MGGALRERTQEEHLEGEDSGRSTQREHSRRPEQRLQAAGMGVKAKDFTFLTFLEGQKNILRTNTPNPCLGFTPGQCLGH